MRIRHFIPLFFFLCLTALAALTDPGRDFRSLAGFVFFLVGFAITYRTGLGQTIRYRDAVLRLRTRMPLAVPFLFFSIPTLCLGVPVAMRTPSGLLGFLSAFLLSTVVYALGGIIVIKDLKNRDRKIATSTALRRPGSRTLVLINPINPERTGLTASTSARFPPINLGMIAALTHDDWQVVLKDEVMEPFSFQEADLVGISAFTANAGRAYQIAALYREKGIPVVMGGIHASLCTEEALQFVDSVVTGEAESVWRHVLADFETGQLKRVYRGQRVGLAGLPSPRRDIFSPDYLFAPVQTSRGCPMDCSFCSVTAFNGRAHRQRPVEEVLDEIAVIRQRFLFFVDDNILGYGKEAEARAIALFKGMVQRKLDKSWFCQASLNFADNEEVLRWAAKSGCMMALIGLESDSAEELAVMQKGLNLRRPYREAFRKIHRHGIAVLGAFIFGSDAETPETMRGKTRFMLREPIDVMQTSILTPLPGTRLFSQYSAEGRLLNSCGPEGWAHFDMSELTFRPKRMQEADFRSTLEKCTSRIYSLPSLAWKFLQTLFTTRRLGTALWALNANMNYRRSAGR
jgi:radical SAM superfamily enzyme YgiQ (UPF0313 family)